MKKLTISLLTLFSSFALAGNQWKVQLPGGGMRFQGELIAEACSVETSERFLTVNMGQVRTNMFKEAGDDSEPTSFNIYLRDCSKNVSEHVYINFSGIADKNNPHIYSVSNGVNAANGVGIAIFDAGNELIPINDAPKKIAKIESKDVTLHFTAKYRATSNNITGGTANAQALFSLTYE
ncbi:fimbrial protein [Providencia huaxiensis]|uniref:fimbrial protein n=1 Tax=Providencia TaxID=586 RepID=UPI00234A398C|nr:fimbrial protein [Providencia sp. PROV032]